MRYFTNIFLILFLFFFFEPATVICQEYSSDSKAAIRSFEEGRNYFNLRDYQKAESSFKKSINQDNEFTEAYLFLAGSYIHMRQTEKAIDAYRNALAIDPDVFPAAYVHLAELEINTAQYAEAKENLLKFFSFDTGTERTIEKAEYLLACARFSIEAVKNPLPFNPVNLGENINTQYDDYWPSLSADQKTLTYTMLLPLDPNQPKTFHNQQEDFYYSKAIRNRWTKGIVLPGRVNTLDNEGAQSLTVDGNAMYFARCPRLPGRGSCNIMYTEFADGQWNRPVSLGSPINSGHSETTPSISPDGQTLYFAGTRSGGQGGRDIWKSTRTKSGWGRPVNLGDSINTPGDEIAPFIHHDNKTLYFSSNRHVGLGGFDLYKSTKKDDGTWSTSVNLGYPINTNKDEERGIIITADGTKGFFASDRPGGFGGMDIYYFDVPESIRPTPTSYFEGTVFDAETRNRLRASVELFDIETGKLIYSGNADKKGQFLVTLPSESNYLLNVSEEGYLFYSDHFAMKQTPSHTPYRKDIPLDPLSTGKSTILRNIFFAFDSDSLKNESEVELQLLVKLLENNPSLQLEIGGHTDNIGSREYNKTLSENRARSVVKYLIRKGIDPERLTYRGYGFDKPVADNETAEGRAQNRRTEATISGTD